MFGKDLEGHVKGKDNELKRENKKLRRKKIS